MTLEFQPIHTKVFKSTTIKDMEKSDVQMIYEDVQKQVDEITLGYALMSIVTDDDLGRGPMMVRQSINKRNIDLDFMEKEFVPNVNNQGLKNRVIENAIIVGVKKEWLQESCLVPMKQGLYHNHVQWTTPMADQEPRHMILYNGNHRMHYMQRCAPVQDIYIKYTKAKEMKTLATSEEGRRTMVEGEKEALRIMEEQGVWLVKFLDEGEFA